MTDDLKKALNNAKTKEQLNDVVLRFQQEIKALSEDELNEVLGGNSIINPEGKVSPL